MIDCPADPPPGDDRPGTPNLKLTVEHARLDNAHAEYFLRLATYHYLWDALTEAVGNLQAHEAEAVLGEVEALAEALRGRAACPDSHYLLAH